MSLASTFERLIPVLGEPEFNSALLESLQSLAGVAYCTLFDFVGFHSAPRTLMADGDCISNDARSYLDGLYSSKLFERDPLYRLAKFKRGTLAPVVYRIGRNDVDTLYRKELYERMELHEKAAILIPGKLSYYCLNMYRLQKGGDYEIETFRKLQDVAPMLSSLVQKHAELLELGSPVFDLDSVTVRLRRLCHSLLTPREIEVCARIVCGYSSEAIALDLGVSVNTVFTHRRRAYESLGIGTQNQLFAIFYENRYPFAN
jgi:DNA-binding CsgD family transcriptional regulator